MKTIFINCEMLKKRMLIKRYKRIVPFKANVQMIILVTFAAK
jgi:hypothetical protein